MSSFSLVSRLRVQQCWPVIGLALAIVTMPTARPSTANDAVDPLKIPEAVAATEAEMKPYSDVIYGTDVRFDMVPIKGGKFTITVGRTKATAREPQELVLTFSDTGPGIPDNERGRIFDRFYRRDGESAAGTGLGLSIAKGAVEANGGDLTLAQSSPTGTTFRIA